MNFNLKDMSIAHWFSERERHRCGYCKNDTGSVSNGMWTETLTVEDYQDLIDRGWRRSGKYCYKPTMDQTCCPQYTIKCDTLKFSLSKSQKKVIKKFNKFLEDGVLSKKDIPPEAQCSDGYDNSALFVKERPNINFSEVNNRPSEMQVDPQKLNILSTGEGTGEPHHSRSADESIKKKSCDISESKSSPEKKSNLKTVYKEGVGADSSKPPCKKAKLLRLERKKEKLSKKGESFERTAPVGQAHKSLEQFIEEISQNSKHKLRLNLVATSEPSNTWKSYQEVEFELYKKYQMVIHNDPPTKLSVKGFYKFLVQSPLKITVTRMSESHELFVMSAKLFQTYQMKIHNEETDECDQEQFFNFLVQTPLKPVKFPRGVEGPGYGSFHQQYWIDDKLVAVGVIDILPRCVSSVYFFYDPDYRNLTLGTYGSLREVQFTRSLHEKNPEISEYYMGFYIHSCQKMRYKGKLVPSFLLCPETYHWIPIEKCLEKLNDNKYSRLEEDLDAIDENEPTQRNIDDIKIIYNYKLMFFRDYKRFQNNHDVFKEIGRLVGKKCVPKIIFCIN